MCYKFIAILFHRNPLVSHCNTFKERITTSSTTEDVLLQHCTTVSARVIYGRAILPSCRNNSAPHAPANHNIIIAVSVFIGRGPWTGTESVCTRTMCTLRTGRCRCWIYCGGTVAPVQRGVPAAHLDANSSTEDRKTITPGQAAADGSGDKVNGPCTWWFWFMLRANCSRHRWIRNGLFTELWKHQHIHLAGELAKVLKNPSICIKHPLLFWKFLEIFTAY